MYIYYCEVGVFSIARGITWLTSSLYPIKKCYTKQEITKRITDNNKLEYKRTRTELDRFRVDEPTGNVSQYFLEVHDEV